MIHDDDDEIRCRNRSPLTSEHLQMRGVGRSFHVAQSVLETWLTRVHCNAAGAGGDGGQHRRLHAAARDGAHVLRRQPSDRHGVHRVRGADDGSDPGATEGLPHHRRRLQACAMPPSLMLVAMNSAGTPKQLWLVTGTGTGTCAGTGTGTMADANDKDVDLIDLSPMKMHSG